MKRAFKMPKNVYTYLTIGLVIFAGVMFVTVPRTREMMTDGGTIMRCFPVENGEGSPPEVSKSVPSSTPVETEKESSWPDILMYTGIGVGALVLISILTSVVNYFRNLNA